MKQARPILEGKISRVHACSIFLGSTNIALVCLMSLQVLNRKVIFNAQITQGEDDITGDLTFDHVSINIGVGFNGSLGVFKVPISGFYQMSFSGSSAKNTIIYSQIYVYNNDAEILRIYDSNEAIGGDGNNLSYTWMMKLSKGDKVRLSSENYLHATSTSPITFTGELIYFEN